MYLIQGTSSDGSATTTYNITLQSDGTSSLEQTQTNLFYGFLLFFIIVFGIVSYFQNRWNK